MLTNCRQAGRLVLAGQSQDRGLCKSLALLNLMLTDSNEDSLLARIEERGCMALHYTSQDLLSKPSCACMDSLRYKQHGRLRTCTSTCAYAKKQQQPKLQKSLCFKVSRQMEANVSQWLGCLSPVQNKTHLCPFGGKKMCSFNSSRMSSSLGFSRLAGGKKYFNHNRAT